MNPNELLQQTRDALTVKRVYGEPYERDGVTVIPAASIRGGAGGGGGEGTGPDGQGTGSGSGGGFGLTAKPAGAFVVTGGEVRWQPAINVNRIVLGGQLIVLALLLVVRRALGRRR